MADEGKLLTTERARDERDDVRPQACNRATLLGSWGVVCVVLFQLSFSLVRYHSGHHFSILNFEFWYSGLDRASILLHR